MFFDYDLYTLDHDAVLHAVQAAVPPALDANLGALLETGRWADAFALANIEVAFDPDKHSQILSPAAGLSFVSALVDVDPRKLLRGFPRADDGSGDFLDGSMFLFGAKLHQTRAAETPEVSGTEVWLRVRSEHRRLVVERVAFDARSAFARYDEVPWTYSRAYSSLDPLVTDGALVDVIAPPRASDALERLADAYGRGTLPDAQRHTLALLLLDEGRIEDALRVCDVALSKSAEALLADDLDTVFYHRLRTLFPKADHAHLQADAHALAKGRTGLEAAARTYLRQIAPWKLHHARAQVRSEWQTGVEGPLPLWPLEPSEDGESVWLVLDEGPVLDVTVAQRIPYVAAAPTLLRAPAFEWRRFGLHSGEWP